MSLREVARFWWISVLWNVSAARNRHKAILQGYLPHLTDNVLFQSFNHHCHWWLPRVEVVYRFHLKSVLFGHQLWWKNDGATMASSHNRKKYFKKVVAAVDKSVFMSLQLLWTEPDVGGLRWHVLTLFLMSSACHDCDIPATANFKPITHVCLELGFGSGCGC